MYTDTTPMPFGKYKGKALEDVPASYLIYLLDYGLNPGPLRDHIIDNLDVLRKQVKEGK